MIEFTVFLLSFILSLLVIPLVIRIYQKNNWVDDPKSNKHIKKTHHHPVPRGGGVPIFVSFIICSFFFLAIDKYLLAISIAALVLTVIGVLDDIYNLHPYWRLAAGLVAGLIVVGSGIGIAYVSHPFQEGVIHLDSIRLNFELLGKTRELWIIADLFALIFILWNMNIVNWSKGLDGQLPAFVVVAFLFLGILSDSFSADPTQFNNALLSFILAGSFAGLLIYNWYPQKIMPGYGAGSLAGFFLSILAILSGAKVATTLMVLAIPTADAVFTIIRRLTSGKSPIWGDRGHLHHLLLDKLGWGRRRVAIFYALTSLIMGVLSLYLNTLGKIVALALSFLLVFFLQIWTRIHTTKAI
ncbi:MAG: Undecaprenyl-phosphate alpha-N-acetylglucosaminyltransferase [Microgenomates bacterium 39_7]|nr:MAG: Undecaprenyl-phosphate alpha-N-acetylglucosaminyltransferase [Microgenomates bacterium 39_7]